MSSETNVVGSHLLELARAELERRLSGDVQTEADAAEREVDDWLKQPGDDWLKQPGAVFVTLRLDGNLRGCIGSLEPTRPLIEDLRLNVVAAALTDPRFSPVVAAELAGLEIEVSLLSAKAPLYYASEAEALSQLRPGVDGVVLEWRHHRATFLPQMWEVLETPQRFLGELKRKAGLSEKFWHQELRLECYTVRKWSESGNYS